MTVHPGYHFFVMLRVLRRKQTNQVSKHCLKCIEIVDTLYITQCTSKHAYDDVTKNEIDYIMTDEPSMVTDVTVINRVNVGRTADQFACYQIQYLQAILTSLQEQGIEYVYIEILKDIYTDSSITV